MNYQQALHYMYAHLPMFYRIGAKAYKKDLSRTIELCQHLNHPEKKLKCIHVAGTNGKGSISHILAAVLQEHGYKTGLYVSPHYKDFRERIKINGVYIPKRNITRFIERNKAKIEEVKPSFFEMTVAMAFNYFAEEKVDYAIIETGLGGRLDSTNVIQPLLSIISNISWDHMDLLGDTLELIAIEKAGIIKPDAPVIIGRKQVETDRVFINKAQEENTKLFFAEDEITTSYTESKINMNDEIIFNPDLKGPFQLENYRTAYEACKILQKENIIPLKYSGIKSAFEHVSALTNMIGRWYWMNSGKKILVDSAHNVDGIKFLCDWISTQDYSHIHIVCGFVKDKDLDRVLRLFPSEAEYYFTQAKIPRALDSELLRQQALKYNLSGKSYRKVRTAFNAAKNKSQKNDLIVVCGSIFVVAEVI